MNKVTKNFIGFFLAFVVLAAALSFFNTTPTVIQEISTSQFVQMVQNKEIKEVLVSGQKVEITKSDDSKNIFYKENSESLGDIIKNYGVDQDALKAITIKTQAPEETSLISTILPFALPVVMILVLVWFFMRQVQGANNKAMSFGQAGAKEANKNVKVRFADVAGSIEAKQELSEVVEFLRNPKKFLDLGAKIPKGVLLLGAPGVGKTLMARAVAGEANVPFFYISGSEFVEMFVGVGASRVRDLFKKAKKSSPCIVFIDEIDAVGRQRGAGLGGSHDEREQTLNQILVEMDGFEVGTTVIVLAATNRPDILDKALLRPGRFDRQVVIDLPDIKEREEILQVSSKKVPLDKNVKMEVVAQRTPGFSGAELANIINEAAIMAARQNKKTIDQDMLLQSIEKVMLGPEKKSRQKDTDDLKLTAYHEAGHALVAHFCKDADPVHKISIISRGRAGGYTMKLPERDKNYKRKSEFIDDMAAGLGGYVVEKEIFGEVSTGPSSDLQHVTKLARSMVIQYGMSDKLPKRTFGNAQEMVFLGKEIHESRDYSEATASVVDEEINYYIGLAYKKAEKIILEQRKKLDLIAETLLKQETIEREQFELLMKE